MQQGDGYTVSAAIAAALAGRARALAGALDTAQDAAEVEAEVLALAKVPQLAQYYAEFTITLAAAIHGARVVHGRMVAYSGPTNAADRFGKVAKWAGKALQSAGVPLSGVVAEVLQYGASRVAKAQHLLACRRVAMLLPMHGSTAAIEALVCAVARRLCREYRGELLRMPAVPKGGVSGALRKAKRAIKGSGADTAARQTAARHMKEVVAAVMAGKVAGLPGHDPTAGRGKASCGRGGAGRHGGAGRWPMTTHSASACEASAAVSSALVQHVLSKFPPAAVPAPQPSLRARPPPALDVGRNSRRQTPATGASTASQGTRTAQVVPVPVPATTLPQPHIARAEPAARTEVAALRAEVDHLEALREEGAKQAQAALEEARAARKLASDVAKRQEDAAKRLRQRRQQDASNPGGGEGGMATALAGAGEAGAGSHAGRVAELERTVLRLQREMARAESHRHALTDEVVRMQDAGRDDTEPLTRSSVGAGVLQLEVVSAESACDIGSGETATLYSVRVVSALGALGGSKHGAWRRVNRVPHARMHVLLGPL